MSSLALAELPEDWDEIIENLVTEDGEPVETVLGSNQPRVLLETLHNNLWLPPSEDEPDTPRKFFANTNIGIFTEVHKPPIVPDFFLVLDREQKKDWTQKKNRSYFYWEYGKVPDVVMEIVSNKIGGELDTKMKRYAEMHVPYYVVSDPLRLLSQDLLRVYELGFGGRRYQLRRDYSLPAIGLSLTFWRGLYENYEFEWLRWLDAKGNLLPTGQERVEAEAQRANAETQRANAEAQARREAETRWQEEAQRAERLAAKLRELGLDPTAM